MPNAADSSTLPVSQDDIGDQTLYRLKWIAAAIGIIFVGAGIAANCFHIVVETNNLIVAGIGVVVAILPWLQSFKFGMDGIQLTTIKTKGAEIAETLQKSVEETKAGIEALQSQINSLKHEAAAHADSNIVAETSQANETVSRSTNLLDDISAAASVIASAFKTL
jgi:hypothetical protein